MLLAAHDNQWGWKAFSHMHVGPDRGDDGNSAGGVELID